MAKDKRNIKKIIENRYKFASLEQGDLFDRFAYYRQLWKSYMSDPAGYPWDYQYFNPLVFSTLRSFVSRTVSGNIGVDLQAWNEQDADKEDTNKKTIEWELQEDDTFLKSAQFVFQAGLYGRGFRETGWLYEKEKIIEEVDENDNVTRKVQISPMVNRATSTIIRPFDVFIANRNITDLQKQPWIIILRWRTIAGMQKINEERGYEVYKNLKKLKDKNVFVQFIDYGSDVMYYDTSDMPREYATIPVLQMWDRDMGTVQEKVRGLDDFLLRDEENPFYHGNYPLLSIPFFPEDDNFWSPGLVQPVADLQTGMNSVLNQYMTNARQQLNNMWITSDDQIPPWEFVSRPNGVIHTKGDIGQLKEVEHKDITQQSLAMMNEIKTEFQRGTSVNDMTMLGLPVKGKGAAAQQMQEDSLDQNLKFFMTIFEQNGTKELIKQFLQLNAQYITDEQKIAISGKQYASLDPKDISAAFTPIITPYSTLPKNNMIRLQNLENVVTIISKLGVKSNLSPLIREIMHVVGITDGDEVLPADFDEALSENEALDKGRYVHAAFTDNHAIHKIIHYKDLMDKEAKLDKTAITNRKKHIDEHTLWEVLAANVAKAEQQFNQQQQGGQPGQGQPPAPGQPQAPGQPNPPGQQVIRRAPTSQRGVTASIGQQLSKTIRKPSLPIPIGQ